MQYRIIKMFFIILLHDLLTTMDPSVLLESSIIRGRFGPRSKTITVY